MKRLLPARLSAALAGDRSATTELPAAVLSLARRRLRAAALLGALGYTVFLALELGAGPDRSALLHDINVRHDVLGLALCAVLFGAAVIRSLSDRNLLRLALAVEFLISLLISTHTTWATYVRTASVGGITWVVPIVILFALMVPLGRRTTFGVSLLCVATMPAGLAWLAATGRIRVEPFEYQISAMTALVALAIATLGARAVYGAERRAAAAQRVGSYELLEPLAQGGMGEVWKARHVLLARPAAIKRVLPEKLRGSREELATTLERFTREARVTATLRSPHTVELYDFGVSDEGWLYYAMELLDGLNLEHFVYRYGPVEPRRAVHWLRQACHSLAEAHRRGLMHRDIKPANLFLCRYGLDADFVKVLDFGITRPLDTVATTRADASNRFLGTAGYMAPEQAEGAEHGPGTDLYALGCVGYWLLSGRRPFEAASTGEMSALHRTAEPPEFEGAAGIPDALARVIRSCLAKRPEDRPADAEALSEALRVANGGVEWTETEARAWWDANRAPA